MIRSLLSLAGVVIFGAGLAVAMIDPGQGIYYIAAAVCLWVAALAGGTQ
jgi:hypothetical protein